MRSRDSELEVALEMWGRETPIPPTPDLRASVGARLRSENADRRGRYSPRRWRLVSLAGALAVAVVATLILMLHQNRSAPRTALPTPTRTSGGLTPVMVLASADSAPAYGSKAIHEVYEVRTRGDGKTFGKRINVWSKLVEGNVATVDIQRYPRIVARRYVQGPSFIASRWLSRRATSAVLQDLAGTLLDGLDGRLIAQHILVQKKRAGLHLSVSMVPYDRSYAYAIVARRDGRVVVRLLLDRRTKELLTATTPKASIHLLSRSIVTLSTEPQLVSAYLRGRTPPYESSSIGAY